jgi:nucleoside-diphosphate kinase
MEQTLVIIKPDGIVRGLEDDITERYEKAGLRLIKKKEITPTSELLKKHYEAHVKKPFYPALESFMSSGRVVVILFEGENAIATGRRVTGVTNPLEAEPGTIRGDFRDEGLEGEDAITKNMVHASATKEEAEKEISLWFEE